MNILFLSVYEIKDSDSGYIYADLIREFAKHEHNVYAVTPSKTDTECFTDKNGVKIIRVKNGQIQKTGRVRKVINLLTLENKTIKAVKKYAKKIKFDFIINMCSNLCFAKSALYFKKRDKSVYYLLMKDIFPQNAVDMGMLKTKGIMGVVYRHFRKKERKMYRSADYIGCMSEANRQYILTHNHDIAEDKVTVVPNSIKPQTVALSEENKFEMREKYGLPQDKIVFIYGGNLGKPQDVPFIIECLKSQKDNDKIFFFIVGDGTDYPLLEEFIGKDRQPNVKIMQRLPREDFDSMVASCDVGMIFLDHRFSIPNYPSRLLSYMQAGIPVFACTDQNTDVGKDIVENGFGWNCESSDVKNFDEAIKECVVADLRRMGRLSEKYLLDRFTVSDSYQVIMEAVK